ncbi:MAG: GNAT family N-acetyltransferase [Candidatus Coproplasma sp.]
MTIRQYRIEDFELVSQLFYETVKCINAKDYSVEQIDAWTKSSNCLKTRQDDLLGQRTLVAEINGATVGFGSIDKSGYLDLLFTHKDYQRHGIATALCNELEKDYAKIRTFSSVTAKPFFESRGYTVVKEQEVERFGVKLKNYEMIKNNLIRIFE